MELAFLTLLVGLIFFQQLTLLKTDPLLWVNASEKTVAFPGHGGQVAIVSELVVGAPGYCRRPCYSHLTCSHL